MAIMKCKGCRRTHRGTGKYCPFCEIDEARRIEMEEKGK
jgi:RNA polymerase subunit RPABC4/transcription elongation factor Spt4